MGRREGGGRGGECWGGGGCEGGKQERTLRSFRAHGKHDYSTDKRKFAHNHTPKHNQDNEAQSDTIRAGPAKTSSAEILSPPSELEWNVNMTELNRHRRAL